MRRKGGGREAVKRKEMERDRERREYEAMCDVPETVWKLLPLRLGVTYPPAVHPHTQGFTPLHGFDKIPFKFICIYFIVNQ